MVTRLSRLWCDASLGLRRVLLVGRLMRLFGLVAEWASAAVVGEQRHGRSEPVHEVAPAHRPQLARSEEPRNGRVAQQVADDPGVMIGLVEQARPTAIAREQ